MKILTDETGQPFGVMFSLEEFNTTMIAHIEKHHIKQEQKPKRKEQSAKEQPVQVNKVNGQVHDASRR